MVGRKRWGRAALAAFWLGLAQAASAAVVYNNGAPNQVSGDQMSEFVVAENFTLGSAATIASIRFWSVQGAATDYLGSVYWAIYSDVAGVMPGAVLFGGIPVATAAVATGASTGFGYLEYSFDIDVVDFSLAAGDYWLGLHNGALTDTTAREMLWETTTTPIAPFGKYFDAANGRWTDTDNEHAFRLDSAAVVSVPEPDSLALVALARQRPSAVLREA